MHLAYISLMILMAVTSPGKTATIRQYSRDWLISDLGHKEPGKRITAKSVFIAPDFHAVRCATGYIGDGRGGCVKAVRLNATAQLDFLLQQLNSMYGTPAAKPDPAPLEVDLGIPDRLPEESVNMKVEASSTEVSVTLNTTETTTGLSTKFTHITDISQTSSTETTVTSSTEMSEDYSTIASEEITTVEKLSVIQNTLNEMSTGSSTETSSTEQSSQILLEGSEVNVTKYIDIPDGKPTKDSQIEIDTSSEDEEELVTIPTTIPIQDVTEASYPENEFDFDTNKEVFLFSGDGEPAKDNVVVQPEVVMSDKLQSFLIKEPTHGVDSVQVFEREINSTSSLEMTDQDDTSTEDYTVEFEGTTDMKTDVEFGSEGPEVLIDEENMKLGSGLGVVIVDNDKINPDGLLGSVNEGTKVTSIGIVNKTVEIGSANGFGIKIPNTNVNVKGSLQELDLLGEGTNNANKTSINDTDRIQYVYPQRIPQMEQIPVRNTYPIHTDSPITDIEMKPHENTNKGNRLQTHNLNPSKLMPPQFVPNVPHFINKYPDTPFDLSDLRPPVPSQPIRRPYENQQPYQQHYPQQQQQQNRNGFVRFPTGPDHREYFDHNTNVVKFPQDSAAVTDDKYQQWPNNNWRLNNRRFERPMPSLQFWEKMPLNQQYDRPNRPDDRRRPNPQYYG